ncbi:MAG: hypothetical protein ACKO7P_09095 [Bacteroidota bacterium]
MTIKSGVQNPLKKRGVFLKNLKNKKIVKMKKRNINEIHSTDSLALTAIIEYWKDYDTNSVVLAYAELKRRNFPLPERLQNKQIQFCDKNSVSNFEDLLNIFLKENQFNSYEDFFEKEIVSIQKEKLAEKTLKIKNTGIDPSNFISAGKAIKNVVYTSLIMFAIALIALLIVISARDMDTIKNIYIFIGLLSLVCNIIILSQLYNAGDSLEKSVTKAE